MTGIGLCLSFVLVNIAGLNSVGAGPSVGREVRPAPWSFSLTTTDYSDRQGTGKRTDVVSYRTLFRGRIAVQQSDPNVVVLEFRVEQMRLLEDRPVPSDAKEWFTQLVKFVPFTSRVTLSPQGKSPLSMQLIGGAADPNDTSGVGRQILSSQYQIIYMILDMMALATKRTHKATSTNGCGWDIAMTEHTELQTDRLGTLRPADLRSYLSPSHLFGLPLIEEGKVTGLRLSSLYQYGQDVKYYCRIVDNRTGFVMNAVNLEAFAKEAIPDVVPEKMAEVLDDLTKLRQYRLAQLQITAK